MATTNTHFGASAISELLRDVKSIYFIGIGGINMSSLAHVTHLRGYRVGGSDRTRTSLTDKLSSVGISINYEHRAENVKDFDAVVYTVAISPDNEEYVEARKRGIPCISRADYLGYLMTGYARRIGVSGMHGKSTTTSMCAEIFMTAGVDPTILSGAELVSMGGAYRVGDGDDFIFEACEYMDSFLDFNPTVALILNVEMDHVDYFHSIEQVRSSYGRFAALTGADGYAVVNADDENALLATENYEGHKITFGIEKKADYSANNIEIMSGMPHFDIVKNGTFFTHVELSVTGYHNIYNSLAAAVAADLAGISPDKIAEGLHKFTGAARRMDFKGKIAGAYIYDDYGHHPTEVKTTLEGAAALAKARGGRLLCAFQSHTYSRTKEFLSDFATAFEAADKVYSVDIYSARETDTLGVSAKLIAEMIGEKAVYTGSFEATAKAILSDIRENDTAIIMGAGDIYHVFDYLKDKFEK